MSIDALRFSVTAVTTAGKDTATGDQEKIAGRGEEVAATSPDTGLAAVRNAAQQLESYLRSVGRQLVFRVDEQTGTTVVSVRDASTGELIRQIPNEEALRLARHLQAGNAVLVDLKV